jgi:moderate conductance mechanosensitive channel
LTRFPDCALEFARRLAYLPPMNAAPSVSAPPPDETAQQARAAFGDLFTQIKAFVAGLLSLDPQEAALRAGISVLVIGAALLILWGLRLLVKAISARIAPDQSDEQKRPVSFRSWTMLAARIAVAVIAALLLLDVWGVNLGEVMRGPVGAVLAIGGRAGVIIVVMIAAIELSNTAIRGVFARVAARAKGPRRAAQLHTIAPVVSGVVAAVLFVITAMMVLAQIGVEIGPLLAGAGIVGLAVGFGAQTLVKDFLTGLFLIIEDVVSIGDVVRMRDVSGLVEDMSLRTIKLRAVDGALHVIPYGEAQIITNMTKDFSYYVFDAAISYSSDLARALELLRETGEALRKDAALGPFIMGAIEIQGVDRLAELGVTLKARIKTMPGKQWMIGREFLKRVKFAFDAEAIDIVAQPFARAPMEATQTQTRAAE